MTFSNCSVVLGLPEGNRLFFLTDDEESNLIRFSDFYLKVFRQEFRVTDFGVCYLSDLAMLVSRSRQGIIALSKVLFNSILF